MNSDRIPNHAPRQDLSPSRRVSRRRSTGGGTGWILGSAGGETFIEAIDQASAKTGVRMLILDEALHQFIPVAILRPGADAPQGVGLSQDEGKVGQALDIRRCAGTVDRWRGGDGGRFRRLASIWRSEQHGAGDHGRQRHAPGPRKGHAVALALAGLAAFRAARRPMVSCA